jgi:tripartite-type tricarboxylate transporter receptor subunit TctC
VAGAGGTIGTAKVKAAAGDGYALVAGHMGTHVSAFSLYQKPTYDPRSDLEPIGLTASAPIVIFLRRDFPAKNLRQFSDELIAKGGQDKGGAFWNWIQCKPYLRAVPKPYWCQIS